MYSTRADRGREGGRERERGRGKRAIAGGPRAYATRMPSVEPGWCTLTFHIAR